MSSTKYFEQLTKSKNKFLKLARPEVWKPYLKNMWNILFKNRFQKLQNDLESISRVFREFQKFKNESIRTSGQHVYFVVLRLSEQLKTTTKTPYNSKKRKKKKKQKLMVGCWFGRWVCWVMGCCVLGVGFAVKWLGWVFGWVLAWSGLGGRVVAWMGVRLGWVVGCWAFFFLKKIGFIFFVLTQTKNKKLKTKNDDPKFGHVT